MKTNLYNQPLENYSSLQKLSLIKLMGLKMNCQLTDFFVQYSFNVHTPLNFHPQAYFTLQAKDAELPPSAQNCCFSIHNFNRWRLDISPFCAVEEYHHSLIRWHRCNYAKSKKLFMNYGCEISFIDGDWSSHVPAVHQLYSNVAKRYGRWLYDLSFFHEAAKRPDYKLLCAWFEGSMIGVFVLQEEYPTLHSICCGMDYLHSSASYAYTWMHYVLIDQAVALQKYQAIDVGLSADDAKKAIGFKPIPTRLDVYCHGKVPQVILKGVSHLFTASITEKQTLKFRWR